MATHNFETNQNHIYAIIAANKNCTEEQIFDGMKDLDERYIAFHIDEMLNEGIITQQSWQGADRFYVM